MIFELTIPHTFLRGIEAKRLVLTLFYKHCLSIECDYSVNDEYVSD